MEIQHEHDLVYMGLRRPDGSCHVSVWRRGNPPQILRNLDPRLDLCNHSQTGFEWGYQGSGPAQLALAILADCLGDAWAMDQYQNFKRGPIATLLRGCKRWAMPACEVAGWIENNSGVTTTDPTRYESPMDGDRLIAEALPSECCGAPCRYKESRQDGRYRAFAVCTQCGKEIEF